MVAAVMLCKDEADIVGFTIEHLLEQLDRVYVTDNLSTDGTVEILHDLRDRHGADRIRVGIDEEVGYWQSRKTTELAMLAYEDGFHWVIPVDADEFWHAADYSRTIKQFLEGTPPDVQMVGAELFNHLPTAADPPTHCPTCNDTGKHFAVAGEGYVTYEVDRVDGASYVLCPQCGGEAEPNPFRRLRWRQREHAPLGKIACRLRPDLVIHAGNHGASTTGTALTGAGLVVRHFSWRSAEQYVRKIRNGEAAYAATDLPESTGLHWRMFAGKPDEAIADCFRQWYWSADPWKDTTLISDPSPGA